MKLAAKLNCALQNCLKAIAGSDILHIFTTKNWHDIIAVFLPMLVFH